MNRYILYLINHNLVTFVIAFHILSKGGGSGRGEHAALDVTHYQRLVLWTTILLLACPLGSHSQHIITKYT